MKAITTFLRDLMGLSGAGLISYGTWLIYNPAGYIACGFLLFLLAFFIAIGDRK